MYRWDNFHKIFAEISQKFRNKSLPGEFERGFEIVVRINSEMRQIFYRIFCRDVGIVLKWCKKINIHRAILASKYRNFDEISWRFLGKFSPVVIIRWVTCLNIILLVLGLNIRCFGGSFRLYLDLIRWCSLSKYSSILFVAQRSICMWVVQRKGILTRQICQVVDGHVKF